jgi:hypothetical protein
MDSPADDTPATGPAWLYLSLLVYTAAAASPAADNLKLLASWAATADRTGDLPTYA